MLRLVLVRHGQTDANLNHFLQGQSDGELNATGLQQAEELAKHLKDFPIDQIFSSNMRRAQDTAATIARYHSLTVKTTPLVGEWHCGVLDGLPAEVFRKKLQESVVPLSLFRPEGGENLLEVRQRAADFLSELTANYKGQTVLVCSHGDFMRALMSLLLQIDIEEASGIYFDNASYTILDLEEGRWNLVALNQTSGSNGLLVSGRAVKK
ncbi:MAG: histidine phosphatase family protein [Pelolinea sp.]|nr:histidine phosphatase family protein [Pelolinea sp.]